MKALRVLADASVETLKNINLHATFVLHAGNLVQMSGK